MNTDASPLQEVEREVQRRANDLALDVDEPAGERALRELIDHEVRAWDQDHRRGVRPHALSDPEGVASRAFCNLARYGPLTELLDDDDVWEIMINSPTAIFAKRHQGQSGLHPEVFHNDDHVTRTLTKLLDDASGSHRKLDATEGLQDAQLEGGARVHIVHGDLSRGGHLVVNIRKFTGEGDVLAGFLQQEDGLGVGLPVERLQQRHELGVILFGDDHVRCRKRD